MRIRVLSGGQTGVDQAALRAARACGLETGGFAPLGWETEDGPAPWLADFGLIEHHDPGYPARTVANVEAADGTLWLGSISSRGFAATHDAALQFSMSYPFLICYSGATTPSKVVAWICASRISILNVAGNRESVNPCIGKHTERFLLRVFQMLGKPES